MLGSGPTSPQDQDDAFFDYISHDKGYGWRVTGPLGDFVNPAGMRTIDDSLNLTAAMEHVGWPETEIRKIMGENGCASWRMFGVGKRGAKNRPFCPATGHRCSTAYRRFSEILAEDSLVLEFGSRAARNAECNHCYLCVHMSRSLFATYLCRLHGPSSLLVLARRYLLARDPMLTDFHRLIEQEIP
jgi:hypothetical protein